MNRRNALAVIGSGISIPAGYVAWNRSQSISLPDGISVDTLYIIGNVFGEPATADQDLGPREEYHRIIQTEQRAEDEISFDDSAIGFVETTNFGDSYLIIVQTGMQTEPDLVLEEISRTDDGLHIDVAIEHPWWQGVSDDLMIHSLLIRATDETGIIPNSISVDIDGYV